MRGKSPDSRNVKAKCMPNGNCGYYEIYTIIIIYTVNIYEWICNKLWYNNYMYCILYRSFHHSSTFHHDLQYHVCKAKNFMFSSTFGLHPSSESVSCKEIEAPMIFAFCCAVAKHSDFFWSFVSQSTLCTNLRFQKKPGVGTHLNANLANMHTDTKTKNSKHSNFMVELWAHSCKTCKGSPLSPALSFAAWVISSGS